MNEGHQTAPPGTLQEQGWVWDPRVPIWRTDAYRYRAAVTWLREWNAELLNQAAAWETVSWPESGLPPLRTEQQAALAAWLDGRQGIVVMPTGTGKTEVALAAMRARGPA